MMGLIDAQVSVISNKDKRNFLTVDDEEYLENISDVYSIVHTEELTEDLISRLGLNPNSYIYLTWTTAHLAPIFNKDETSIDLAREYILYEAKFKCSRTRKIYKRLIAVPESYSYDKIIETGHCLYSGVEFQSIKEFPFKSLRSLIEIEKQII
ncbi:hypothetical protein [Enterococcus faecalis]|uniref:hypothetical protein n=1 Tax=Enterococcus faecalis TaxID=1351 RepID=UPI0027F7801C|nr:hypothetical protein [Enterococcus faecalis]ELT8948099.1 hypothetical protein [Enterococcus faecalis]